MTVQNVLAKPSPCLGHGSIPQRQSLKSYKALVIVYMYNVMVFAVFLHICKCT